MGFMALHTRELVTLGGFMFFWGWVFLGSTMWVILEKQDEHTPQPGTAASQLYAAYKEMWLVLQLPAVREMALVLLTVKAPLAAFDALGSLELQACASSLPSTAPMLSLYLTNDPSMKGSTRTCTPGPRSGKLATRTSEYSMRFGSPARWQAWLNRAAHAVARCWAAS